VPLHNLQFHSAASCCGWCAVVVACPPLIGASDLPLLYADLQAARNAAQAPQQGCEVACLPRTARFRSIEAAAYQRVEGSQPRVRRRSGLTAEGLHLEATLGPGGGVHVLARQTVAAHLRHVRDAKTMTALSTAPP
jgi:hypothetical protein